MSDDEIKGVADLQLRTATIWEPTTFNPEPVDLGMIYLSPDRELRLGRSVYAAMEAAGYKVVKII